MDSWVLFIQDVADIDPAGVPSDRAVMADEADLEGGSTRRRVATGGRGGDPRSEAGDGGQASVLIHRCRDNTEGNKKV